jgi:predicted nucleotidyltransferase component of viral defense system
VIAPSEVAKLARKQGVDQRVIEKDYVLSWVLAAIADSDLAGALAFKGGTALKKVYYADYRFSEDLDFTVLDDLLHDDLVRGFGSIYPWLARQASITVELRSAERSALDSTTMLVNYVGPLQARLGSRNLKIDFTRGENLLYPVAKKLVRAPYSDYPAKVRLPTYTREEILVENLCALIGRREPRDLYDAYYLLESGDLHVTFLGEDFARKARHKGYDAARLDATLAGQARRFEKLWTQRLAQQVADLPDFDQVLRAVRRHVRKISD